MVYAISKRCFDLVSASIALILLSPVLLITAVLVRRQLGAPIFYVSNRSGKGGKPFSMIKFRTMTSETGQDGQLLHDDQRMTKLGRLLRSTSIDELPELINIIRGDMSIVGPRPLLLEYNALYSPRQAKRLTVKPGLTGWAQVNGRNAVDWSERLEMDSWYIDNKSWSLDLKVILKTISVVIKRDSVSAEGHSTMPKFTGNADDVAD